MKEKRRLFLALPIPETLKELILQKRSALKLSLKWIPEENLHVTVLFLGSYPNEKIARLSSSVKTLVHSFPSFNLHLHSLKIQKGRFQEMIWVSFQRSLEFEMLSEKMAETLDYEYKRRAVPHINLVRSKEKIRSEMLPVDFEEGMELPVKCVELWESHLSPKGATYSCLESFPLKG